MVTAGDPFPRFEVPKIGGGTILLPDDLAGAFGVVLFNRGSWCPYCTAQLTGFARAADALADAGIQVVSLSVDEEATAAEMVAERRLPFPVGHSADAEKLSELTGAFTNTDPPYLQSTGFVLEPGGRVVNAVYSTGAIGRLVPDDVIGLVRHTEKRG
jgi:peroxiredoxin